jgi:transglutaminase-like putative cysteine protease
MRICVAHETVYRYDTPASGVIQTLRLTPRNHNGQYVVNWRIDVSADCRLEPQQDAFGNIIHAFSAGGPISELRLLAEGEVETQDMAGVVHGAVERFPPSLFLRETALTHADETLSAYSASFGHPAAAETLSVLHKLLARIHDDIDFDPRPATPGATAAEAFADRRGTCQDLTHIFIAVARMFGVPARYVSGYLHRPDGVAAQDGGQAQSSPQDAGNAGDRGRAQDGSHAWVEAHVPDLGWVGFDPANGLCVTDRYIRVAVGLDGLGAARVRGAFYGGGRETAAVKLQVTQASWQTQG